MKRHSLVWMLSAVAMLAVAALTYWFGVVLLPSRATAQTVGTIVPWYLTWGLVWMTVLIAIVIAVNLFMVALGSPISALPDHNHARSTPDARLR